MPHDVLAAPEAAVHPLRQVPAFGHIHGMLHEFAPNLHDSRQQLLVKQQSLLFIKQVRDSGSETSRLLQLRVGCHQG